MNGRYKAMWHLNGWGKPIAWGVWDTVTNDWAGPSGISKEDAEAAADQLNNPA